VKILKRARRRALVRAYAAAAVLALGAGILPCLLFAPSLGIELAFIGGLIAFAYLSSKALRLWQGRGIPSLHRSESWTRRFVA
jgi:hypothetical protein